MFSVSRLNSGSRRELKMQDGDNGRGVIFFIFFSYKSLKNITVDRHFPAVTFFSRLGDFSQIED